MRAFSHEEPLFVVLPEAARVGEIYQRFLGHPAVHHFQLPAPWCLDLSGIDLPAFRPDLQAITVENLPEALEALTALCDQEALDGMVAHAWTTAEEAVRDFYLRRSTMQTFAAIFKLGKRTIDLEPPAEFVTDRIHEQGFDVQYRLGSEGHEGNVLAPSEEGSLVFYAFDPRNEGAREEAGLPFVGASVILEAFVYADARARHRAAFEAMGSDLGWRVVEPGGA